MEAQKKQAISLRNPLHIIKGFPILPLFRKKKNDPTANKTPDCPDSPSEDPAENFSSSSMATNSYLRGKTPPLPRGGCGVLEARFTKNTPEN